ADVYPNPTNGHFNVAVLGVTEGVVLLEVLDITGKAIEVITINSPSNDILQLGGSYGAGVYMMRFTQGDKMFTTRVVKN
ncbi:MAG: Secretion system C-terminal sorting domain, partial [Bacteroidota bacterium]